MLRAKDIRYGAKSLSMIMEISRFDSLYKYRIGIDLRKIVAFETQVILYGRDYLATVTFNFRYSKFRVSSTVGRSARLRGIPARSTTGRTVRSLDSRLRYLVSF